MAHGVELELDEFELDELELTSLKDDKELSEDIELLELELISLKELVEEDELLDEAELTEEAELAELTDETDDWLDSDGGMLWDELLEVCSNSVPSGRSGTHPGHPSVTSVAVAVNRLATPDVKSISEMSIPRLFRKKDLKSASLASSNGYDS